MTRNDDSRSIRRPFHKYVERFPFVCVSSWRSGFRVLTLPEFLVGLLLGWCNLASAVEEPKSYPILSGIGIALKPEDETFAVTVIAPNSPAEKSGKIEKGDQLVSVEIGGKSTSFKGMSMGEAVSLIRGPVGTKLTLVVRRKSEESPISVELERAALAVQSDQATTYDRFVGKRIADLTLSSLDGTGKKRLSDLHEKVVVLDFWASWCGACYQPVTKLQQVAEGHPEWKDKVEFIAVTVDSELADAEETIRKRNWHGISHYAIDFDDLKQIGVSVIPVAIIISRDGTVVHMAGSHSLDFEEEIAAVLTR